MQVFLRQAENNDALDTILKLREEVFCKEQKVPYDLEVDEYDIIDDSKVLHFGLYVEEKLVGCSRVLIKDDHYKLGRVAILKSERKNGYGFKMLNCIMAKIGPNNNWLLSAQSNATKFYNLLGFQEFGDTYMDANIKHIDMKREKNE